ncbi:MAG: deoxyribose-phosphate aldolase [Thermoguttaceae bacterium]|jgi:deoxyribose-phosphate aldolase|nr:deoxyribose-phosphate aldolase [Thermoguttaceae bacterium]
MSNELTFDLPGLLDVSAVQMTSAKDDVAFVASLAAKFNCKAAFALSGFLPFLKEERDRLGAAFLIGGVVGYPSGQTSTRMKCAEAKILVDFGVDETDMVLNVGYLLSGMCQEALDDIKAVKQTVGDTPLKVIIEAPVLEPDDVKRAAELVVQGGAQWVKTGTGWTKNGTTLDHLRLIREAVGYDIGLKVAGGVGDLATIRKMLEYKVGRFGIGRKARAILEEYEALRGE